MYFYEMKIVHFPFSSSMAAERTGYVLWRVLVFKRIMLAMGYFCECAVLQLGEAE